MRMPPHLNPASWSLASSAALCQLNPGQGSPDLVSRHCGGSWAGSRVFRMYRKIVGLRRCKKISNLFSFLFVSEDAAQSAANAESEIVVVQMENNPNKGETFCTKNVSSQMRFVANAQSFVQILGKSKTVPNILCGERNSDFSLNWTGNSWESKKMWIRNRRFNQGSVSTYIFSKLPQLTSENGPIGKLVPV